MTTVASHERKGTWVDGYYRNGYRVSGHCRSSTTVKEHDRSSHAHCAPLDTSSRIREYNTPLTYPTKCWWCGELVFFHRAENGGCALFDELGWPWPLHVCWEAYRHTLLNRIGAELEDLNFNGRSYEDARENMTKDRGQSTFFGTGFVEETDHNHQENEVQLGACHGASTATLIPIHFVPDDHPREYLTIYVPRDRVNLFPPYSLHRIKASWVKRGNRWLCLVIETRVLRPNVRPAGRATAILRMDGRCYYCNTAIGEADAWGLDDVGNQECASCGQMRFRLPSGTFIQRVLQISQNQSPSS